MGQQNKNLSLFVAVITLSFFWEAENYLFSGSNKNSGAKTS